MDNKDTHNATNDSFNVSFLFSKKEKINKKISDLSKRNIEQILKEFAPPFDFIRKGILESMGMILYEYMIEYFVVNPEKYQGFNLEKIKTNYIAVQSENAQELDTKKFSEYIRTLIKRSFKFYFWPGFTTLQNKRVFIWVDNSQNQGHYYTGIGYDNDKEFRNCPTTLAYNQVLNADNFIGTDFFPGSTHNFRVNQSKIDENWKKEYFKLRNKGHVFKAIHVTTDKDFKEEEESHHALLISIRKENIKDSSWKIKKKLGNFLKGNNVEKNEYYFQWPFDALPYEEKIKEKQKNITSEKLINLCEEKQRRVIDIQTHLYSYWIAETLGDGSAFKSDENKQKFKKRLHELLENNNLLELEGKLGFFEKIDNEKQKFKANPCSFKDVYFNHWYTIFHESFSLEEDLGSTMLLSNYKIPHQLLYHVSSWIEDIYNSLKLLESKTMVEFNTYKDNFRTLAHSQIPFFNYFRNKLSDKDYHTLIPVVDLLQYGLTIAKYSYFPPEKLKQAIEYERMKTTISISNVINDSIEKLNTLCRDNTNRIYHDLFKIESPSEIDNLIDLATNHQLFSFIPYNESSIETHQKFFETLVIEILINAVKHSDHNRPNIQIEMYSDKICFKNSKPSGNNLKKDEGFGLKMCQLIAAAISITLMPSDTEEDFYCITIQLKDYKTE